MVRTVRLLLAPAALAVAAIFAAGPAAGAIGFRTPSKNIGCTYMTAPNVLRCDILSGLKPEPSRRCALDWTGISLAPTGRAQPTCAGDTAYRQGARILGYGSTWRRDGVRCVSRRTGLRCVNRSGHGFVLARASWRVF